MSNTERQDEPAPPRVEPIGESRSSSIMWVDRLRWPLAFLGAIALISITVFYLIDHSQMAVQSSYDETISIAKNLTGKAESIATKFRQGTITKTFVASLPSIEGSGSGRLELTTLESTERFRTEDKLSIWWDYVSLGTTTSEISVPVTYRYHLKLDDSWALSVSNQTCLVTAPKIRPTIPPSIDTGQMQKSTQNGWARFNADDQLEELERSLTSTLVQYADDEIRMALIREEARKTVAMFVKNWLLREDQWREDRFHSVIVRFEGEEEEPIETVSLLNID